MVSDLKPAWWLIALYRRRYPIEAKFRDYKSSGWHWEHGQVKDLDHVQRLLVAMALATWLTLMAGTWRAQQVLSKPPTGKHRTLPWEGKMSLFQHGLKQFLTWLGDETIPLFIWHLTDWFEPNWSEQLRSYHARTFVWA